MDKLLSALRQISDGMEELGNTMLREEQVYKAELADRLAKGLQGDAAIGHYNEWMEKAGMTHLMVK
ncbi:hypothetical protein [Prevotella histicola]|uniref:hypothetical protein n=1 Tax=Prevotella histicola TaxID=470565 RepID=UPI0028E51578|nr:hypothetical protein [Prevotella histicola]